MVPSPVSISSFFLEFYFTLKRLLLAFIFIITIKMAEKQENSMFWDLTDMDKYFPFLALIRILQAIFMTSNMVHPDEYW